MKPGEMVADRPLHLKAGNGTWAAISPVSRLLVGGLVIAATIAGREHPHPHQAVLAAPPGAVVASGSQLEDAGALTTAAESAGVPPAVMWAVARVESGTKGGNTALGPGHVVNGRRVCREIGRMQVNPCAGWAKVFRRTCGDTLTNYLTNLCVGAHTLAFLHRSLGSWLTAVPRYNGRGALSRQYLKRAAEALGLMVLEGTK